MRVSTTHLTLAREGEGLAVSYLQRNGYRILEQNYRAKLGEIDIIADHKGTLCFIEVKTRKSCTSGWPAESVTLAKQRKLSQVALCYLKHKKLTNQAARFDVVSVIKNSEKGEEIQIIPNAFELNTHYTY